MIAGILALKNFCVSVFFLDYKRHLSKMIFNWTWLNTSNSTNKAAYLFSITEPPMPYCNATPFQAGVVSRRKYENSHSVPS